MFGFSRRRAHATQPKAHNLGADSSSAPFHLASLASAIQQMVGPADLRQPPQLGQETVAITAAREQGRDDAKDDPFDEISHRPRLPQQDALVNTCLQLLELLGARARAIVAADFSGSGVVADIVGGWRVLSWRTRGLLLLAAVVEGVLGAKLVERLTGVADAYSWLVGIAISLICTLGTLAVAEAVHRQSRGIVSGTGAWIAGLIVFIALLFLGAYAWGLGGGAETDTGAGGIEGGGVPTATSTPPPENDINWALTVIYLALMLLILASVILSHLIDLSAADRATVRQRLAAQDAELSPRQAIESKVELLEACLELLEQAKLRVQALVAAYVGGVQAVLPPAVFSLWEGSTDLTHLDLPDPDWVLGIRKEVARLRGMLSNLEDAGEATVISLRK